MSIMRTQPFALVNVCCVKQPFRMPALKLAGACLPHARAYAYKVSLARVKQARRGGKQPCRSTPAQCAAAAPAAAKFSIEKLAAEVIGYGVIAGSLVRSLPQILRCYKAKSVDGLSLTSIVCETWVYFVTTAYNWQNSYQFSTYGDVVSCLVQVWVYDEWMVVQNILLIGLLFIFGKFSNQLKAAVTITTAVFGWWCLSGAASPQILMQLQAATVVVLAVGGRMPQIWLNWQRGNSGELSFITSLLNVMGCAARVFTTVVLTGDIILLWATGSQFFLNAIILWQVVDTAGQNGVGPLSAKYRQKLAAE